MEDPDRLSIAEIPGADPKTPHPVLRIWRGIGNIGLFVVEAVAAVLELFRPPRREDDSAEVRPRPRRRRHPIDKSAGFPIND